jgi:lysophospholipid acyltransferase (LPLAT)-like uncharacterized protein
MGVFAFSSRSETQGMVLTEAMAAGVPIVALDASGVRDVIREAMKKYRLCGIAIDGPLGPYHEVKRRLIQLAASLGFLVPPVSIASGWKFILPSRWDRMELPYPSARVCLVFGNAIRVTAPLVPGEAAVMTRKIQKALDDAEARAEDNLKTC